MLPLLLCLRLSPPAIFSLLKDGFWCVISVLVFFRLKKCFLLKWYFCIFRVFNRLKFCDPAVRIRFRLLILINIYVKKYLLITSPQLFKYLGRETDQFVEGVMWNISRLYFWNLKTENKFRVSFRISRRQFFFRVQSDFQSLCLTLDMSKYKRSKVISATKRWLLKMCHLRHKLRIF